MRIGCGARLRQKFALEDAIEFHAFAPLEASRRVTDGIPLGSSLLLPVHIVNCVQTLKARAPLSITHTYIHNAHIFASLCWRASTLSVSILKLLLRSYIVSSYRMYPAILID
jgi:hypothetical protein